MRTATHLAGCLVLIGSLALTPASTQSAEGPVKKSAPAAVNFPAPLGV